MTSKKLIIVGNKKISKNISNYVDNFDCVVRLNRMQNYRLSGTKTDLLLADIHYQFIDLTRKPYDKYLNSKKLLLNNHSEKCTAYAVQKGIFTQEQINDAIPFSIHDEAEKITSKKFPTNLLILTHYILNNYINEYEIWLTCCDVYNRKEFMDKDPNYQNSWHRDIGGLEQDKFIEWIDNGLLHYINYEKHTNNNTI